MSEQTHRASLHDPASTRVNQPGREEGVVRADSHPVQHERPEEWGWHGETGRWGRIEDLWVLGIAGVMILIMVLDWRRRRNAWRAR